MQPSHFKSNLTHLTPVCAVRQNVGLSWVLALMWAMSLAMLLSMTACTFSPPMPGTSAADLQRQWGQPTARYALPEGAQRLEFASGPEGRTTWMVDVDALGRVQQSQQVLTESNLMAVQAAAPMPAGDLLRRLGTPGESRGARGGGQTWSWRYVTNDCLWFQFSLDAQGVAQAGAFAIDARCDAPSDARN